MKLNKSWIVTIIIIFVTASSSPWWWSPVTQYLERAWENFNTSVYDPSKTINGSVFDVINNLNHLSTDIERQSLVKTNYSGLGLIRSPREYGVIINTQIQGNINLVEINAFYDETLTLICEFSSKWDQKLKLIGSSDISFWGRIKEYDPNRSNLILEDCWLYQ